MEGLLCGLPAVGDVAGDFAYDATHSGDFWGYVVDHSALGDHLADLQEQLRGVPDGERADLVAGFLLDSAAERYEGLTTERGILRLTGDVESVLSLGLGGSAAEGSEAAGVAAEGTQAGVEHAGGVEDRWGRRIVGKRSRCGGLERSAKTVAKRVGTPGGRRQDGAGGDGARGSIEITDDVTNIVERHTYATEWSQQLRGRVLRGHGSRALVRGTESTPPFHRPTDRI